MYRFFGRIYLALMPLQFFVCCAFLAQAQLYVAADFTAEGLFTPGIEGPAVDKQGNILAVNYQQQGTIGITNPNGDCDLFVNLPEGSIGNGIRINHHGWIYVADYTMHNVLRIDPVNKQVEVYAHESSMNQPNDLTMCADGTLFASDPNWKESTGQLWRIDTDGSVHLLESDMGTTNGIEVSPDETRLYVNESVSRVVWVYDLDQEKRISKKRTLISFPDFGMDGMRCDEKGNLYITRHGKGTVAIVSPEGIILHEVKLKGTKPSNIAFGGPDGKTCYVTLQDRGCFESFRTEYAGQSFRLMHKQ